MKIKNISPTILVAATSMLQQNIPDLTGAVLRGGNGKKWTTVRKSKTDSPKRAINGEE